MKMTAKSVFAEAIIKILKPIIKVLIRNEISHGEFMALAKRAYIEVAYESFSIPGRKTTYSRIAVLTGLNRKEVVRLSKTIESAPVPRLAGTPNRAMRVVNGWLNDEEFLDKEGRPKILPIRGEQGSFSALVARYSGDITLGAVADELERVGIASRPDRETIKLNSHGYIPTASELEKIKIMAMCAADLLDSAIHNLDHCGNDARFQRQVIYEEVPRSIVNKFKEYSDRKSGDLLQDYNRWLKTNTENHPFGQGESTSRIGVGIYYFEQENRSRGND